MPFAGVVLAIRVWLFLRRGVRVIATVVGEKSETFESGESRILPVVTFRDLFGRSHRITLSSERPAQQKGVRKKEIGLIYLPRHPAKAKIDHWSALWIGPIVLFAPALALLIAFGCLFLGSRFDL